MTQSIHREAGSPSARLLAEGSRSTNAPPSGAVEVGLTAAVLSVADHEPLVLCVSDGHGVDASVGLPSGAFTPLNHRTLEIGLRTYVATQTSLELGYVEQLYTFGDRGRHATTGDLGLHTVSIGYLALTSATDIGEVGICWRSWYDYFPWEDRRTGLAISDARREVASSYIQSSLHAWAATPPEAGAPVRPIARADRVRMCFPDGGSWDEEKVLERYELLYEAGLVEEASRDGRASGIFRAGADPRPDATMSIATSFEATGHPMRHDHRRILATAIGRIRGKIKYRPVIFELLPDEFTLFELQRTVEAILGPHLHKQNFRRLVETGGLVEPTGDVKTATGGRPARLYRFRREVLLERPAPGVRVNPGR